MFHPAVAVRNRYQAPRYLLYRLSADNAEGWAAIPPIALLTDMYGDEVSRRGEQIRFAYDEEFLYLRAEIPESALTIMPELSPDDGLFWRQDHLEFRLQPDPADPARQMQFLFVPDGRFFDSLGLWKRLDDPARPRCCGQIAADRWSIHCRIPLATLDISALTPGMLLRALAVHSRWANIGLEAACSSAVEIGFQQAERFTDFVVAEERPLRLTGIAFPSPTLQVGKNTALATLHNTGDQTLSGAVLITRDPDPSQVGECDRYPLTLPPGRTTLSVRMRLERPAFNAIRVSFEHNCIDELGSVSLRAGVPTVQVADYCHLQHPYICYTPDALAAYRQRLMDVQPLAEEELSLVDLPAADDPMPARFVKDGIDFFRLAEEWCMAGAKGGADPAARIWQCLTPSMREVCRDIIHNLPPSSELQQRFIDGLNELLQRPDLYTDEHFGYFRRCRIFSDEVLQQLDRDPATLSLHELTRMNRAILTEPHHDRLEAGGAWLLQKTLQAFARWRDTGDARLIAHATACLRAAEPRLVLSRYIDLREANLAQPLALAYDAFAADLDEEDRAAWVRVLERFLDLHLAGGHDRAWPSTTVPNANPVTNGAGGLLALALLHERPEKAAQALFYARKYTRTFLDFCEGEDGGNTEGVQYWEYGFGNFLLFAVMMERVLGVDDGFFTHPAVRNASNMLRLGLSNDGCLHGVNDTVPMPLGGTVAYLLAAGLDDPLALWYGDLTPEIYADLRRRGVNLALAPADPFLRPARPALAQPPLPTAFLLPDIQYATLRSGENYDCALFAGIKGARPPYTHHNQSDTGAIHLDIRGERLLLDPGYYKDEATDHSLPIIDGISPQPATGYAGKIIRCESSGDLRLLACNVTPAYRGAARRVVRHLVMVGEEGLISLDDIVPANPGATIRLQYQLGGETSLIDDHAVLVAGRKVKMRLDLLSHPDIQPALQPERSLRDTHWGYARSDCRLFPVFADCIVQEDDPLVSVFLDATDHLPGAPTLSRQGYDIIITLPSGRTIVFSLFESVWMLDVHRSCRQTGVMRAIS